MSANEQQEVNQAPQDTAPQQAAAAAPPQQEQQQSSWGSWGFSWSTVSTVVSSMTDSANSLGASINTYAAHIGKDVAETLKAATTATTSASSIEVVEENKPAESEASTTQEQGGEASSSLLGSFSATGLLNVVVDNIVQGGKDFVALEEVQFVKSIAETAASSTKDVTKKLVSQIGDISVLDRATSAIKAVLDEAEKAEDANPEILASFATFFEEEGDKLLQVLEALATQQAPLIGSSDNDLKLIKFIDAALEWSQFSQDPAEGSLANIEETAAGKAITTHNNLIRELTLKLVTSFNESIDSMTAPDELEKHTIAFIEKTKGEYCRSLAAACVDMVRQEETLAQKLVEQQSVAVPSAFSHEGAANASTESSEEVPADLKTLVQAIKDFNFLGTSTLRLQSKAFTMIIQKLGNIAKGRLSALAEATEKPDQETSETSPREDARVANVDTKIVSTTADVSIQLHAALDTVSKTLDSVTTVVKSVATSAPTTPILNKQDL